LAEEICRAKISTVVLDLNGISKEYDDYESLSAAKKVERIFTHIENVAAELAKKDPNNMHIVTWREYGISEGASCHVSVDIKNKVKELMLALTKKYPSLTIVAGPMAVKKHFDNFSIKDIEALKKEYQAIEHIKKIEEAESKIKNEHQVMLHLQAVTNLDEKTAKGGR